MVFDFPAADALINIWNSSDGTLVKTLKGHRQGVNDISWAINDSYLVSVSDDLTLRLWKNYAVIYQIFITGYYF